MAEHVPGRQFSLLDGIVPVFDTVLPVENRVEKVRDVTGSKNIGLRGLQKAIDQNTVANLDAASPQETCFRAHAGADHHHIAGNGSAGLSHHRFNCSFALEHCRRVTDDNLDPLRFEGALEKGRHLRIVQFIEQHPALDQGHRQASLPQ